MDADHGSWPQDGFCQVAFNSGDVSTSYQASSDLYNFIGRDGVNFGHLGLFFNAEDQDHYDFVYFRLEFGKLFNFLMKSSMIAGERDELTAASF